MTRHPVQLGYVALLCLAALLRPAPAAAESGRLKLMVVTCPEEEAIDNALIEVTIFRPGIGIVAQTSGSSDEGYVEFELSNLQELDEARVSVSPAGRTASDHRYYWMGSGGSRSSEWDLGSEPSAICDDDWFDESEQVIKCMH